jgi:hypothetical protein
MLPLYPQLKAEIERCLIDVAWQAAQGQLGPFAGMPPARQHEGDRLEYMTIDGDEKRATYQRAAVDYEVRPADIPTMTFHDAVGVVAGKGRELGVQQAQIYYESLNQSLEEVGNAVDAGGQPFSVDLLLQLLEKVQISFDEHGNPQLPTLHIGPDLEASASQVLANLGEDPSAQARLNDIIEKKKEVWNAEQDRRKLVD